MLGPFVTEKSFRNNHLALPYTHVHTHTHMYAQVHTHTHVRTGTHTHTCTHRYTHMYAQVHTHTHTHTLLVVAGSYVYMSYVDVFKIQGVHLNVKEN